MEIKLRWIKIKLLLNKDTVTLNFWISLQLSENILTLMIKIFLQLNKSRVTLNKRLINA